MASVKIFELYPQGVPKQLRVPPTLLHCLRIPLCGALLQFLGKRVEWIGGMGSPGEERKKQAKRVDKETTHNKKDRRQTRGQEDNGQQNKNN